MDNIKIIDSSQKELWWFIQRIATKPSKKSAIIIIQEAVNTAIKSMENKPANLENCRELKSFLEYEKAEIVYKGLTGDDVDELVTDINRRIATLDTGIALGERELDYQNGSLMYYKKYEWFKEGMTFNTETIEGYLMAHYDIFSNPRYSLPEFVKSGYWEHCKQKGWNCFETAETFCRLYNKPRFKGDTKYTLAI